MSPHPRARGHHPKRRDHLPRCSIRAHGRPARNTNAATAPNVARRAHVATQTQPPPQTPRRDTYATAAPTNVTVATMQTRLPSKTPRDAHTVATLNAVVVPASTCMAAGCRDANTATVPNAARRAHACQLRHPETRTCPPSQTP